MFGNMSTLLQGDVAHDAADSGNPVKVGMKAIAHGTNPTAVTANDRTHWYANRHGVPFVIGGHPNIKTVEYNSTATQTNDPMIDISAGTKIAVTMIDFTCDNANSADVGVRIGFGASLTAEGASGVVAVDKIILSHPGVPAGSGIVKGNGSAVIGIGGDGEDLIITIADAPGTKVRCVITYFTIES
jgi:hypothetical protein